MTSHISGNGKKPGSASPKSELAAALKSCRGSFLGVGLVSSMTNVLMLTGPFFMLELYDRVLPSRSVPTLIGLGALAAVLFAFQGLLEWIRGRILVRIGGALDETLSLRVHDALVRMPLKGKVTGDGLQPLRDLDQVRSFLSSPGPMALFDFPWIPFYLGICFLFHVWIGLAATIGGLILVFLTYLTEVRTRGPAKAAVTFAATRNALAEAGRRNAEVLQAMGMAGRVGAVWARSNGEYMASQRRATDVAGGLGALSKVLRLALQSAVLGLGGYLAIRQEATAGIIIASSILTARALAPVELAIANWKGFVAARQSWRRLTELLILLPAREEPMALAAPSAELLVEAVSLAPPGGRTFVVRDVSFALKAGNGLGIIGPSAAGKSSLVRGLVGVWAPVQGTIRLDGAALDQWSCEGLGRHIGYLPQDVELFDGTVAENIARFHAEADPTAIIAAAKQAGVNDLILRLPQGYETRIGEGGMALSAGQRQRVALARALYGDPFLVVLDEPNSNLDHEGEEALTKAISGVRTRGGIVIVVSHRASALASVDLMLVMKEGKTQVFGPRDEVMAKLIRRFPAPVAPATPLRVVAESGQAS
jgi:PrtD family type I secretion system ABC transporter